MQISGIKKTTLLDYPGKVATIIFTPGCNLRCEFCHNPEFVLPEKVKDCLDDLITEEAFFNFLKTRVGFLDGVVICGGEPTIQKDLPEFAKKIKDLGFLVKLDTNGSNPDTLELLLQNKLVDYVAMDVKDAPEKYNRLIGVTLPVERFERSIDLLLSSSIGYEFRTTLVKGWHTEGDVLKIAKRLSGAKNYYLQNFRSGKTLNPTFVGKSFTDEEMVALRDTAAPYVEVCKIRM